MSYQRYGQYAEIPQARPVQDDTEPAADEMPDASGVPGAPAAAVTPEIPLASAAYEMPGFSVPQQPAEEPQPASGPIADPQPMPADPQPMPADLQPMDGPQIPFGQEPSAVPPVPPMPDDSDGEAKKKKHHVKKVLLIVGITAAVLWTVAAAIAVVSIFKMAKQAVENDISVEYSGDISDFSDLLPSASGEESGADEYDNFADYFAGTYSTAYGCNMPTTEAETGMTMPMAEAGGASDEPLTYQEIYSRVSPAIAGITTYLDGEEYGWGTAVLFTSDGYLITNDHIIETCDSAVITLSDGTQYDAMLIGTDSSSDIAVLKIDGEDLPYAEFADSTGTMVGDEVVAIGNPLGEDYALTMTNGIISGINRSVSLNGYEMTMLQTNAELNEGNSGGALVNMYGQVIGITNMKIMYNYYSAVEGIGFAVPSSVVKTVADELLANGYVTGKPALGIVAAAVNDEAAALYDLPHGVYVSEISDGSDALNRDIQVGDIITEVNGTAVSTVDEVNTIKNRFGVGDTLTLTIYRDGETFTEEITLVDSSEITK